MTTDRSLTKLFLSGVLHSPHWRIALLRYFLEHADLPPSHREAAVTNPGGEWADLMRAFARTLNLDCKYLKAVPADSLEYPPGITRNARVVFDHMVRGETFPEITNRHAGLGPERIRQIVRAAGISREESKLLYAVHRWRRWTCVCCDKPSLAPEALSQSRQYCSVACVRQAACDPCQSSRSEQAWTREGVSKLLLCFFADHGDLPANTQCGPAYSLPSHEAIIATIIGPRSWAEGMRAFAAVHGIVSRRYSFGRPSYGVPKWNRESVIRSLRRAYRRQGDLPSLETVRYSADCPAPTTCLRYLGAESWPVAMAIVAHECDLLRSRYYPRSEAAKAAIIAASEAGVRAAGVTNETT